MIAKKIWQTLSNINVNDKAEKKGNLTYLSWTWAWGVLMNHFPESSYEFLDTEITQDGHVTVWCAVTVGEGDQFITRKMWLPVMDNRNNAVVNPDARKISDTRMRCLVKCISMFGLGAYIYAGEDLPEIKVDAITQEQQDDLANLIDGCGQTWRAMAKAYNIKSLDKIDSSKYEEVKAKIIAYKAKLAEKENANNS